MVHGGPYEGFQKTPYTNFDYLSLEFVSNQLTYLNLEMHFLLCPAQIDTNDRFSLNCFKNIIIELDKVHKISNHV
jgi:hypothetical protein